MKLCNVCHTEKRESDFYSDASRVGGKALRCKDCVKGMNKEKYIKKRQAIQDIIDLARKRGCSICGIDAPEVIQLHHVEPKGRHWSKITSIHQAKLELRKCVPLCANCHLQVHAGTAILPTEAQRVLT